MIVPAPAAADPLRFRRELGPGVVEIGCEYPPDTSPPPESAYPVTSSVTVIPATSLDPTSRLLVTLTRDGIVAILDASTFAVVGEVEPTSRARHRPAWLAPTHATAAGDDTYLVCTEHDASCWWVGANGSVLGRFEARAYGCRSAPTSAARVDDLIVLTFPLDGAIVAVSSSGAPAWISRRSAEISRPHSVVAGPRGQLQLLVADAWEHAVVEISPSRPDSRRVVFGQRGRPGVDSCSLNNPRYATYGARGEILIADSKNNRIIELDQAGRPVRVLNSSRQPRGGSTGLYFPTTVSSLSTGELIVADAGNDRVIAFGCSGSHQARLVAGTQSNRTFHLAHPRGAHVDRSGAVVVTDSYNDRALLGSATAGLQPVDAGPLTWPRFAVTLNGGAVVADGRGAARIVVVAPPNGSTGPPRAPTEHRMFNGAAGRATLADPHHIHLLDGDRAIVVDSEAGVVAGIRLTSAHLEWQHAGFHDPHMAAPLPDGGLLVSNTGADEIVEIDAAGVTRWRLGADEVGMATGIPLRGPRCAQRLGDGSTLVLDSDNGRVLHVSPDARTLADLLPTLTTRFHLKTPRWLDTDPLGRFLLLSDFDGHRLVAVDLAVAMATSASTNGSTPWASGSGGAGAGTAAAHRTWATWLALFDIQHTT